MAEQSSNTLSVLSTHGESDRFKCAIAYVLLWVTGLLMLVLEVQDRSIKFHSLQSIIYSLVLMLIGWVPLIGWALFVIGWLYALYGAYIVYTGREFKIPYIGEFVEKNLL